MIKVDVYFVIDNAACLN